MCARNKLCLHFESAEETARHLRAFDIACSCLLHPDPIDALQVRIAVSDKECLPSLRCGTCLRSFHACQQVQFSTPSNVRRA